MGFQRMSLELVNLWKGAFGRKEDANLFRATSGFEGFKITVFSWYFSYSASSYFIWISK